LKTDTNLLSKKSFMQQMKRYLSGMKADQRDALLTELLER